MAIFPIKKLFRKAWSKLSSGATTNRSLQVSPKDVRDYARVIGKFSGNDNTIDELFSIFRERGVNCEALGKSWWFDFINATALDDHNGADLQQQLIDSVRNIAFDTVKFWEWLHIYSIALQYGLFNLANELRLKSREAAISSVKLGHSTPDRRLYLRSVAALIEIGDMDSVRKEIASWPNRFANEKNELSNLISLMQTGNRPLAKEYKNAVDQEFSRYIAGRRIVIMGPAEKSSGENEEAAESDIIVRFNAKPATAVHETGSTARCDVSYYNSTQTRFIISNHISIPPAHVSWVIFRKGKDLAAWRGALAKTPALWSGIGKIRSLTGNGYSPGLYRGHLTAMPAAIIDLLRNGADTIKVLNSNLMLTVNRQAGYKNHAQTTDEHKRRFIRSCAGSHDPVTQLAIVKQLVQSGRISGDAEFMALISMSESEYMNALQGLYGNVARRNPDHC